MSSRAGDIGSWGRSRLQSWIDEYRFWQDIDEQKATPAQLRDAARELARIGTELTRWIDRATPVEGAGAFRYPTAESQVLANLSLLLTPAERHNRSHFSFGDIKRDIGALLSAIPKLLAVRTLIPTHRHRTHARRVVARRLCWDMISHGYRPTAYENGDAVRLLLQVARAAGDTRLTPTASRKIVGAAIAQHCAPTIVRKHSRKKTVD